MRGTVAYVPQEAYVRNESLRANILFDAPCDEARYTPCPCSRWALPLSLSKTKAGRAGLLLWGASLSRPSVLVVTASEIKAKNGPFWAPKRLNFGPTPAQVVQWARSHHILSI